SCPNPSQKRFSTEHPRPLFSLNCVPFSRKISLQLYFQGQNKSCVFHSIGQAAELATQLLKNQSSDCAPIHHIQRDQSTKVFLLASTIGLLQLALSRLYRNQ